MQCSQNAVGKFGGKAALVHQTCDKEGGVRGQREQNAEPCIGKQAGCKLRRCKKVGGHGGSHRIGHSLDAFQIRHLHAAASRVVKSHNEKSRRRCQRRDQNADEGLELRIGKQKQQQDRQEKHQQE